MNRRGFLSLAAATPVFASEPKLPQYRIVTRYKPIPGQGMPGKYPGQVARVHSDSVVDEASDTVNAARVEAMIDDGMKLLTGDRDPRDSWARFIEPHDVVGIKVNCSGAPRIMSSPEVVAAVVKNLTKIGVAPERITIYERFPDQMRTVGYEKYVPAGVTVTGIEGQRGANLGYDPYTYVEVDFFGEDDTRSNMVRLVTEKFTKIVNIPNMKEHQAAGVTGCLKNIAYGDFSNVARSHRYEVTNTYSFIGTLASVEPLRSRTVLSVMDGLRGVWHGGPFNTDKRFRFYPKMMQFGTDPVAMDHLLLDVIEAKRKQEGAPSLWDRSRSHLWTGRHEFDPQKNLFIREPGHIQYASTLGLGVYDLDRIHLKAVTL
jgi:uncharacterized protein (DUF362 family)